ncbi:MAG: hypothetical protein A3B89_04855 [Candidatus Buchananbacteria bacterium RIFCSPHIGHO2_02_FULL_40_13]|uniref:Uncharacterized protein n=1 Tax=Candidatus Buchananbacteria bacterium RIFCSPLOWO2_01_FULL_39_33 TaxID=1797543 RepID=A0A1G1YK39_9BACT|nr:MAG: hypothetical protein A3B89_04855 [Candidatus Buchananbacteria bacterium RIFCSPHIGHO2_02_FULL_40_13]OGY52718.1 MAG: hypothetical protein A3A02_02670 [Candidatus Buchananbacteria bacterium RIFCSPLOWO2_01_FULL_39_33]
MMIATRTLKSFILIGLIIIIINCINCATVAVEKAAVRTRTLCYFHDHYLAIDLVNISKSEQFDAHWYFAGLSPDFKQFIKEQLPFVKIREPEIRDLIFVNQERELLSAYRLWFKLQNKPLTREDREAMANFDRRLASSPPPTEYYQLISQFPWLDVNHLSVRDKLFLNQIGDEIATAIMAVG